MKTDLSSNTGFDGLRVAAFESRRNTELARLIEKRGGVAFVSHSMQEVIEEDNRPSIDLANHIMTGEMDALVLMTGVGVRYLMRSVERHVDMERFLNCLTDMTTIARGPKAIVALKEYGINPTLTVAAPNTWREVLATFDTHLPANQVNIAIQEYGKPNASLVAGLEARGAKVHSVKVYRWELPEDTAPLRENLQAIVDGDRDVLLFTSAHQLTNLLALAEQLDLLESLRDAMKRSVVVSIGPTTSEWIRDNG
ncbi:MAG: uroporphyrinogen-III synthase, partial [Pirellulaceae bacterium]|nr:uroporphyrinogen-III synthase [Pirellulaceae bacterium]